MEKNGKYKYISIIYKMDKSGMQEKDIKKCFEFLKSIGITNIQKKYYDEGYKYITYPIRLQSKNQLFIIRISGVRNFQNSFESIKKLSQKLIQNKYNIPGRNLLPPNLTHNHRCAISKTLEKGDIQGFIIENKEEAYEEDIMALVMTDLNISLEDYLSGKTNKYYKYCVLLKILHAFAVYHTFDFIFPKSRNFGKNIYLDVNYEIKFINIYDGLKYSKDVNTKFYKNQDYQNFIQYIVKTYNIDTPINNLLLTEFLIEDVIENDGDEIEYVLNFIGEIKRNIVDEHRYYNQKFYKKPTHV
jgi:hypothetical protein